MPRSDLDRIQTQLKVAIHNHQMLVSKMTNDPQNINLQVQLHELQSEIRDLSGKQKSVVEQLKNEILAMQVGSVQTVVELIGEDSAPVQTSPTDLSYKQLPLESAVPESGSDNDCIPHTALSTEEQMVDEQHLSDGTTPLIKVPDFCLQRHVEDQIHQRETSSRIARQVMVFKKPIDLTLELDGNNSFEKKELGPEEKKKLEYMASLNLITINSLKELQSRRSERKRKNASNPQFWYGNLETEMEVREDCCTICHRSGELLMCDVCSLVYHLQCLDPPLTSVPVGLWSCPKCQTLSKQYGGKDDWPGTLALVHSYLMHKAAKDEEKKKMQKLSEDLATERGCLEQKVKQLKEVLSQILKRKSELAKECSSACQSLENMRKFIQLFTSSSNSSKA